jgi:hypothetical protein
MNSWCSNTTAWSPEGDAGATHALTKLFPVRIGNPV